MRRILIDTHILIWWLSESEKIKSEHLDLITNPENTIYISTASFFEISLKMKKGKLQFDYDFEKVLLENSFENLAISLNHLQEISKYSFPNQDPFDMLIMVQALTENLELISYDQAFDSMKELRIIR